VVCEGQQFNPVTGHLHFFAFSRLISDILFYQSRPDGEGDVGTACVGEVMVPAVGEGGFVLCEE
jgi:hypothetical protein